MLNEKSNFERVHAILDNKDFLKYINKNKQSEKKRTFCRHGLAHLLDVARIAYILNLEQGLGFRKDLLYAAALLHDIGKWKQYKDGIPHALSSAELALGILEACRFDENEIMVIKEAILSHSCYNEIDKSLKYLLYKGDKLSRNCFICPERQECKWDENIKNKNIEV